jgi:SAM-dependent methyltransferase
MSNTAKDMLFKAARLTARGVIPASIKTYKLYRKLRGLLATHNSTYDAEYYARYVEPAAVQSAGPISNSIISQFSPKSVIDVGCGTGALLAAFRERGCLVAGIEYSDAALHYCRARGLIVTKFDIEQDIPTSMFARPRYDIAISLEVAEHLPEKIADRYVGLLCGLSSIVIFSAATPGQGGTDHVNEQPHSYWIEKFSARGYSHDGTSSKKFAQEWSATHVANFYCENIMVFRGKELSPIDVEIRGAALLALSR